MNIDAVMMFRKYRFINILALLYFSSVFISKTYNGEYSWHLLLTFLFHCTLLPFIELQRERGHIRFLLKTIVFWFSSLLLVNDILMIIMPGSFYGDGIARYFFMGNKFSVGYDHMILLIALSMMYSNSRRFQKWMPVLFLLTCGVCYYIDCRTTIFGTLIIMLVWVLPEMTYRKLDSRIFVTVLFVLCASFVLFINLAQVPSIKYFIIEVLHRDVTITGRKHIFAILPKVIRRRPWLGYGSTTDVIRHYIGAYDTQNGFFELVVANGFPSAFLFVMLLVSMVKKIDTRWARFLLGGIFAFIVMSTVEVTFNITLIVLGILFYTESREYKEQNVRLMDVHSAFSVRLL